MIIIMHKISRTARTFQAHIIMEDLEPNPKSLAAGILLREELRVQDQDYIDRIDSLDTWLEFREQYLKKILEAEGTLTCKYCGHTNLEIGGRSPKDLIQNNKNKNLATIDHILALANGGEKYDEKNMCVSCKKCNRKKSDKPVGNFISSRKNEK